MANRTLQAKAMKLRRQNRKLPRRYTEPEGEFTEHSKTPIPARLKAEGVRAPMRPVQEILQIYRNSANSLKKEEAPTRFAGVVPGRKEVFDRLLELHFSRIAKLVDSRIGFTILDTKAHWARVYRNAEKTAFVILYVNFKEGVMKTSMSYRFQKNIVDDFRADKLTWVECRAF